MNAFVDYSFYYGHQNDGEVFIRLDNFLFRILNYERGVSLNPCWKAGIILVSDFSSSDSNGLSTRYYKKSRRGNKNSWPIYPLLATDLEEVRGSPYWSTLRDFFLYNEGIINSQIEKAKKKFASEVKVEKN